MLITKTNPIGMDAYVQQLQVFLHDELKKKWNLQDADLIAYPRCYRNKTSDGYIAENFIGGASYEEVYYDNSKKVTSFFGLTGNVRRNSFQVSADMHLVYFADLAALKPTVTHRADEEVKQDVTELFGLSLFSFQFTGIDTGIENVLKEYPGSRRDDRLKYVDMHPVHCFRINMKLIYNPNKHCINP